MVFEDRIQVNPRLIRLLDPRTNEIVDFEIQDLEPEEIIQEGTEITAENLNGQIVNEYSESRSNVYSCNYINSQAIYCRLNSEVTTNTSGYQNITNWAKQNSAGSLFTLQNGQVKIPAGVTKVKVTTKLRAYHAGTEALYSFITKNSINEGASWTVDDVNGYLTVCNQAILDVQENDLMSVNVYGNAIKIQASSTTMIVEKLA